MTQIERRKEWEAKVSSFKTSGQSVSAWCEEHDVKPHRLWYWMRKLEPKDFAATPEISWMAVEVREQPNYESDKSLLVRVGNVVVEVKPGFDPVLFSDVVRTLQNLC